MSDIDINMRPFVLSKTEYTRDGDPVMGWIEAQTDYISKLYDYPKEYIRNWIKEQMKEGGLCPFFDRKVKFIHQTSLGNREQKEGSFYQYQNIAREEDYVLSPSQTAYKNPVKYPALTAMFTDRNAKQRSVYKKTGQDAKVKGQKKIAGKYGVLQQKKKEVNNSFSGANSSWFNALCNGSGHQSLTSTCRSATSYANITAEKFLAGNRVYVNIDIVLQELSNAVMLARHEEIMKVVRDYNLKIPTEKDVYECAEKSFSKYFKSKKTENEIKLFISTMDEASRCSFVYLGDLYHLDKFNPKFVDELFSRVTELSELNIEYCEELYPIVSDDIRALVFGMMKEITKGKVYVDKTGNKGLNEEEKNIINNTIKAYFLFLDEYKPLIEALWRPNYLPSGMAYLRTMLREVILTSDTDSAIMTMQYWTKRITGSYNFSTDSYSVAFNLVYFVSESVANAFGKLCVNMGVPAELIDQLGAKNEYAFPVYCISEAMKHYFAEKAIEEGRVLPEPELEKKGVGYISARHDAKIERNVEEYFVDDIIGKVKEKIYLSVDDVLGRPLRLEKETRDTIRSGGLIYQTDNIKEPESYKQGEGNATYKQFLLWQEIFAPTYGTVDEPPYSAYKVPVALSKKRDIQDWFDRIEDRAIAARAKKFFEEQNITQMSGILVPTQIAELIGIPKEIVLAVDEKRATSQIMGPFYLALGGLGFFHGNNSNTKLITDHLFRAKNQDQLSTVSCPNPIESV